MSAHRVRLTVLSGNMIYDSFCASFSNILCTSL